MNNLYYATFEKGYDLIIEKFIKKQDKNSIIKKIYNNAVLFLTNEHFPFFDTLFFDVYQVIEHSKRVGTGSINSEMKHLMEMKDLKINFPKEVQKIKISYNYECKEKISIDQNLKSAFEIMIKKNTKKQVGYFATDGELSFFLKNDGECIFAKKIINRNSEFSKITSKFSILPQTAFALNFLSNPLEKEVSLDPFSSFGMISYVRAFSFKKANVIANCEDKDDILAVKNLAKKLKEKSFSVMNYDFLSDNFPIKFIDKIVTILPDSVAKQTKFFEKTNNLKIKTMVILAGKYTNILPIINGLFDVCEEYNVGINKIYKLSLAK